MIHLYKIEWLKMKRQRLWLLLIVIPLIGCSLGALNFVSSYDRIMTGNDHEWYQLWTQMTFFYALFLMPILSSVLATFICRVDHLDGGWKCILALPISRNDLYFAKFTVLMTMIFFSQIALILIYLFIGLFLDFSTNIPFFFLVKVVVLGTFSVFPIAAFQLWLSFKTKSFTTPITINIVFTLGSFIAMIFNIDFLYLWSQPSIAMKSSTESSDIFNPIFVLVSFLVIFLLALRNFYNKDIL